MNKSQSQEEAMSLLGNPDSAEPSQWKMMFSIFLSSGQRPDQIPRIRIQTQTALLSSLVAMGTSPRENPVASLADRIMAEQGDMVTSFPRNSDQLPDTSRSPVSIPNPISTMKGLSPNRGQETGLRFLHALSGHT
jgi:hypothetical protein